MDYHGVIEDGIRKGDIAPIYKTGSKEIKRVKFKDGEEMDYKQKKTYTKMKRPFGTTTIPHDSRI